MLAYLAIRVTTARWHAPAVLAAVPIALTIGASRILLQVHYTSDVVARFSSGLSWLVLCIAWCESRRHPCGKHAPVSAAA
nr:phosphatase PAP2 family protein [Caenimonas sedimenti]